jgi:hypothetical protein
MRGGTGGRVAAVSRLIWPRGQRPSGWHREIGGSESSLIGVMSVDALLSGVVGEYGMRVGDVGSGALGE